MCSDIREVFIHNSYGFVVCLPGLLNYFHICKSSSYLSLKRRKGHLAVQMQNLVSIDQDLVPSQAIDFDCDLEQISYSPCPPLLCKLKDNNSLKVRMNISVFMWHSHCYSAQGPTSLP